MNSKGYHAIMAKNIKKATIRLMIYYSSLAFRTCSGTSIATMISWNQFRILWVTTLQP